MHQYKLLLLLPLLFLMNISYGQDLRIKYASVRKQFSPSKKVTPEEQLEIDRIISTLSPCPKPLDAVFHRLCRLILNQDFSYDDQLYEMACVEPNDSRLLVIAKIQLLWKVYFDSFICNSSIFSVHNGNILKYAVASDFPIFIEGVADDYNLNINKLDPADGKTLLDFAKDHIEISKLVKDNEKITQKREDYYQYLKDLGSKHSSELK